MEQTEVLISEVVLVCVECLAGHQVEVETEVKRLDYLPEQVKPRVEEVE